MNKKNIGIIGAIIVAIIVAGIGGYLYYKRTPTYTFNIIREAVQKHDYDTFSKHVDTENIISSGFDVLVEYTMDNDSNGDLKGFAEGIIKALKPAAVSALNDEIKRYVKTGEFSSDENKSNEKQGENGKTSITESTNIDTVTFKSVGDTRKDGDFSITDIIIRDNRLERDFTLSLKMKQLDDGTYQVLELSNLREYLDEVKKATEEKLAEINKPIQDEINDTIHLGTVHASLGGNDRWNFNRSVDVIVPATVNSSLGVKSFAGEVVLTSADGKKISYPFEINLNNQINGGEFKVSHKLNPFMNSDASILKNGIDGYVVKVNINSITFNDDSQKALKTAEDLKKE